MSTYIFIPGKDPRLSLAELKAVYPSALLLHKGEDFLIMDTGEKIDQKSLNRLGGVVKIAELTSGAIKSDLRKYLIEAMFHGHTSGKLSYGVSVYGWPEKNLRTILIGLKKSLKSANVSSRFANHNFRNLSVAQYKGLKGPELLVCKKGSEFFVGRVIATQDIDSYSKRDYKKPFRDMRVGMLPPKLAQIMINLAGSKGHIWDPFCGGGVLIMEGMLMGHDMLGSDINKNTLEGARRNIDWTIHELRATGKAELFHHDATAPLLNRKFDSIVFEGYLGPPQNRIKTKRDFMPVVLELTKLYEKFFHALGSFKGPIVSAIPFFRTRDGDLELCELIQKIEKMGFKKELDLKYSRHDQLVGRAIYRFMRS